MEFGMRQFVPFIQPSIEFAEKIEESLQEEVPEVEYNIVKPKSNKKKWRERT